MATRCLITALRAASETEAAVADQLKATKDLELCRASPQSLHELLRESWDALIVVLEKHSLRCGLELCARCRCEGAANVLVVGAGLDRDDIVALLGAGAVDYLSWPASNDEAIARIDRAAGCVPCTSEPLPASIDPRLRNLIGRNPAFLAEIRKIPAFAQCGAGVLIFGETGTGKEICAQAIHYLSPRASHPCVAVNCGAIPTELIEAELFGHVKGAFTSASHSRDGLVREADGGTLFLDDVDGLPAASQSKLLRFLEEREYRQVGSNRVHHADVRVIAASNRRLDRMVATGEFRGDLYFRLNVLALTLPPLRERREDIALIARHFVRHFAKGQRSPAIDLSSRALSRLMRHDWPGNVRELMHVIERAVLMASSPLLTVADLALDAAPPQSSAARTFRDAKAEAVGRFERDFLESLLLVHAGNVTHAAEASGKHRRAFVELMRKHGIKSSAFRGSPGSRSAGAFTAEV